MDVTVDTALSRPRIGKCKSSAATSRPSVRTWQSLPAGPQAEQLWGAVAAVFASWMNDRAKFYRRMHDIPRKLGHRGQRAVDGVRQYGRDLGHRRCLHPQPVDGRKPALRRVSDQRPRRGRGGRHPHAAGPDQSGPRRDGRDSKPSMEEALPEVFAQFKSVVEKLERPTTATCRTSSSRSKKAGSTCCRPATASARPRRR